MKNLLFLAPLIGLLLPGCSKKVTEPKISYDGSTFIKLVASQVIDSINFEAVFVSYLTNKAFRKNVIIQKDDVFIIEIPMILPELVDLIINNKDSLTTYLIPGDTLLIKLKQELLDSTHCYTIHSIDDNIFKYCQARYKKFGYHKILYGPARKKWLLKYCTSQKEYNMLCIEADSVEKQNITFLEKNRKSLPYWFVDLEKNNITYIIANCKLIFFESLTNYSQKDKTVSVPIYNPEAHLSFEYYRFLNRYFLHGYPLENNSVWLSRTIKHLNNEYVRIDSILKGDIKRVYLTWKIAELYSGCESDEEASEVDSFTKLHSDYLTKEDFEYINKQKEITYKIRIDLASLKSGDIAPDFDLKDLTGKNHKLSDYKGKIIYLHFWATWCGPCLGELPILNKLIIDINSDKIAFINVCLDNDINKWKQITSEKKLLGMNLICDSNWSKSLNSLYKISLIPHYTLIDENGLIIKNNCVRPGNINTEISKLLNNK
jgi:peroxiredoxin